MLLKASAPARLVGLVETQHRLQIGIGPTESQSVGKAGKGHHVVHSGRSVSYWQPEGLVEVFEVPRPSDGPVGAVKTSAVPDLGLSSLAAVLDLA